MASQRFLEALAFWRHQAAQVGLGGVISQHGDNPQAENDRVEVSTSTISAQAEQTSAMQSSSTVDELLRSTEGKNGKHSVAELVKMTLASCHTQFEEVIEAITLE